MSRELMESELSIPAWVLKHFKDAILMIEENGNILFANESAEHLLDEEDIVGDSIHEHIDLQEMLLREEGQVLAGLASSPKSIMQVKSWKLEDQYCIHIKPVRLNEEKQSLMYSFTNMLKQSSEGMVLHEEGRIIDCDHSFAQLLGYTKDELINQFVFSLVDPKYMDVLKENMHKFHDGPYRLKGVKKNGESIYVEVLPQVYSEQNRYLRIAIIRDITEQVRHEQQVEFMAYYDELTDLPNRNFFNKVLEDAIFECKKISAKWPYIL